MKSMRMSWALFLLFAATVGAARAGAQAQTTGDIAGVVTDPSNAVIVGVPVTLKSTSTGITQASKTGSSGEYRFSLLQPGQYTITVTAQGFQPTERKVVVFVGQIASVNIQVSLASSAQSVEVNIEQVPLLQTENGNTAATLSEAQVQQVPIPGNDINFIRTMAPGAISISGGSPSMFGLPTSSNLITLDGMEDVDPWNNGTNGGASNLLLGLNEVQEATVVSNGYSGQYGTLAGSNVNVVTKGGTNEFHGRANWTYNDSALNANNWFKNRAGTPRPFQIANQWAGDFGGPVKHEKLFFYFNTEGIRVVLPAATGQVQLPSSQLETATIANLTTNHPNSVAFYNTMFSLYNAAPGASSAANDLPNGKISNGAGNNPTWTGPGCGSFMGLGSATAASAPAGMIPCAVEFRTNGVNKSSETIFSERVDYNINQNDHAFVHVLQDHGTQATGTDPINTVFNAFSPQPQWQAELVEAHTFGANAVNSFNVAGQHYAATFEPADLAAALKTFPTTLSFSDSSFTALGGGDNGYPTGRNVTRYQFSDDYSRNIGRHNIKVGFVMARYDVTDKVFGAGTSGLITTTLTNFYNGLGTTYSQSYPLALEQPIVMYRLGGYVEDEFHISSNFSFTLALRGDHPSIPVCNTNCFARTTAPFVSLTHDVTVPYNKAIQTGLPQALPGLTAVEWQPRLGFAWQPFGRRRSMVVRGGIGLFGDNFPISIVGGFAGNLPLDPTFSVSNDLVSPAESTNLIADAAAAYKALITGFNGGQTLAQIKAAAPTFTPPNLTSSDGFLQSASYQKWSLEVQQGLWRNASLSVSYNGTHGFHILTQNGGLNGYAPSANGKFAAAFSGLPTVQTDPRFNIVTVFQSNGTSNYNGALVTFLDRFGGGTLQLSYTFSHALDNGIGSGQTRTIEDPYNLERIVGPSDFDIRHFFAGDYVWNLPLKRLFRGHGSDALLGGWQVSGLITVRSGAPYSVTDNTTASSLSANDSYSGTIYANFLGGAVGSCSGPQAACLTASQFSSANTPGNVGFGAQQRNFFRGPAFFDTDFSLMKRTKLPHWERAQLGIGIQMTNAFNHPNFNTPTTNLASSTFGTITTTVNPSSSPLGANGGDASPRLILLRAEISF